MAQGSLRRQETRDYRNHADLAYAKNDLIRLLDLTYEWALWDQTE